MTKILKGVLGPLIFLVTLALLSFFLFRSNAEAPRHKRWVILKEGNPLPYPKLTEIFGHPGLHIQDSYLDGDQVVRVDYVLNEFGHRLMPLSKETLREHLFVAGCSFVFGTGLPIEETLPYILSVKNPDTLVSNLGFNGGGLHTTLRYTELVNLHDIGPLPQGKFVFVMIFDQLYRFNLRKSFLSWAKEGAPFYVSKNGSIDYGGRVEDLWNYWPIHWASSYLPNGLTQNIFHKESADDFTNEELAHFIDGVIELKRRYLEKYPNGEFYWINHPLSAFPMEIKMRFLGIAKFKGIEILDANEDFVKTEREVPGHRLPDFHPSYLNNQWFSSWLEGRIK